MLRTRRDTCCANSLNRLRMTGVVDVQNPVEQAMREGRFNDIKDDDRVEELDDD